METANEKGPGSGNGTAKDARRKAEKTLKLIIKLLAKAEGSPYPEEAQTFQEHAERLMVRYGIQQASIDTEAGKAGRAQEPMVEERFELGGQLRVGQARGFTEIALAFNTLRVLQATTSSKKIIYLIGAESDVAQALRLFASLRLQLESAMAAWWLGYPYKPYLSAHEKVLERRQFQVGFLNSVAGRIRALYDNEMAAGTTGSELVLASRSDRADEHVKLLHPAIRLARRQSLSMGSHGAHAAGSLAGTMASVGVEVAPADRRCLGAPGR
ncbi:DUF2786 domain-containing protein [Arthrobacter sp. LAPM80]|uniref:DUF2786 domain-containing protein n=1 Tax=Arthrobacter sp. LAPM80 TaxID=3141788 RepID=UPI00398A7A34